MSGSAIFAIVVIGLIVVALAFFLVRIILALHQVIDTLGKVVFGVRAIAHSTEPITPVVTDINRNLSAVAGALEAELVKAGDPSAARATSPASETPAAPIPTAPDAHAVAETPAVAEQPAVTETPVPAVAAAETPAEPDSTGRDEEISPTTTGIYRSLRPDAKPPSNTGIYRSLRDRS